MCAVVVRYTLTLDLCEQTDLAIGFYNILLALLECFSLLFIRFTSVCCSCDQGRNAAISEKSGDLVTLVHHDNVSWRPQKPQKWLLRGFISLVACMCVSGSVVV